MRWHLRERAFVLLTRSAGTIGGKVFSSTNSTGTSIVPNKEKIAALAASLETRGQYLYGVNQVVEEMVKDPAFANQLLQNFDSVLLTNLYNENRVLLEPITGKLDGRSLPGRYAKIIHVAELYDGVNSLDGVDFVAGSEEMAYASSSSSCSGCDAGGSTTLGCCIVHFWGWSQGQGGSCSPCC